MTASQIQAPMNVPTGPAGRANRSNQSMKGLGRVVIGSAVGGLLGAAAFFAVDGLVPVNEESYEVRLYDHGNDTESGPVNGSDGGVYSRNWWDSGMGGGSYFDNIGNTFNCNTSGQCYPE